jgi:hypothetical protein
MMSVWLKERWTTMSRLEIERLAALAEAEGGEK